MRLDSRMDGVTSPADRQALLRTIEALEGQRGTLGDSVVDLAIAPLRARLATDDAGILAPSADRSAERKVVTVLFVDVAGFTAMSERLGSEATLDMVNSLFEQLVPVVERYGGVVDKFIGDEIMAVFGAPRSVERHAEYALRAALAMFDALEGYNRAQGVALALHAGVNTGEVVAGEVGSAGRRDYSVTGDAVNVAARLEGAARGGEVLVGSTTYRQTFHLFEFEPLEPLSLKGKSQPLSAYRLVGPLARAARAAVEGLQLRFSGREAELDALLAWVRTDARPGSRAIAIRAQPGLGKSRLVSELHDRVVRQVRWFEASGQDYRTDLSYGVVSKLVDDIVGLADGTDRDTAIRTYSTFVGGLEGERARQALPYLLRLRGLPLDAQDEAVLSALGADALRQRMASSVRDLLVAVTAGQSTIVCLEDMHWSDPSSVALFRALAADQALAHVCFVLTTRPDQSAASAWIDSLSGDPSSGRIVDLSPLTDRDSRALLDHALAEGSAAGLMDEIRSKAQGNPLYLASFLRSLVDRGLAILVDGRVAVDAPLSGLAIPDTLQAVVGSQIDRLPARGKDVLHWAAILGNTFTSHDIEEMARAEGGVHDVEAMLAVLRERQLIEPEDGDRLRFVHALVRDVGYEQLLARERRRLHGVAARIVEHRIEGIAEPTEASVALICWHLERAGIHARASQRYEQAAAIARSHHAHPEELLYLESAIRLADGGDSRRIAALRELAADALQALGRYAEAAERLGGLVASTDASAIELARLHRKIGRTWTPRFTFEPVDRALEDARRSLAAANERGSHAWWREHFAIELFAIWALYMQGRLDEGGAVASSLEPEIETQATLLERGQFHRGVALMRLRKERYRPEPQTIELARLAVNEVHESGDTSEICLTMFGLPFSLLWSGAVEEAQRAMQQVLDATVRLGDAERNLLCLVYLAVVSRQLGDVDSAEAFAKAAVARARANGSPHYEAVSDGTLAWVAWRRGEGDLADRFVELAQRTTVPNYPFAWIYAAVGVARAMESSDLEAARSMVARMLDPSHQRLDSDVKAVFESAIASPDIGTMQLVVDTCRRVRYL